MIQLTLRTGAPVWLSAHVDAIFGDPLTLSEYGGLEGQPPVHAVVQVGALRLAVQETPALILTRLDEETD